MRKGYPSDIKREQFEAIRPLLESARRKTAPRKVELYEVFCAVLYLLRTGCQWRALPSDCDLERATRGWQPAGAGFKKIRLARPERDWGATPAARS